MLVITDEEYPTIKISRKYGEIKGSYFGPFLPAKTARAMKELIHKLFKLRTCDPLPKRNIVCLTTTLDFVQDPVPIKYLKGTTTKMHRLPKVFYPEM
jgi:excinuclease ABC subunit C